MALLTDGIEPDGRQRKESRRPDHELHRSEVLLQRVQEAREITKTGGDRQLSGFAIADILSYSICTGGLFTSEMVPNGDEIDGMAPHYKIPRSWEKPSGGTTEVWVAN